MASRPAQLRAGPSAPEAGIQLELLRAQSFESGKREAAAAVAEMSARLASPSGYQSPG